MDESTQQLDQFEALLREGMRLNRQPSLGRRGPDPAARPMLERARRSLADAVNRWPDAERAWRLLALAEETLLRYAEASVALRRAVELSGRRDARDLKKLALLEQSRAQWQKLLLTPPQLDALGEYLHAMLADGSTGTDLRWTEAWLEEHLPDRAVEALAALRARGGYTDVQVLQNVVKG